MTDTVDLSVYANSLFCKECGSLLSFSNAENDKIVCTGCSKASDATPLSNVKFTTNIVIREQSRYNQSLRKEKQIDSEFAVVNEECPKCKHHEMRYFTMQLRSADEGQTVFYECSKCLHKHSVNN
ncbi:DNA-directed RNA polymerase I subunit RPA12 [Acrasis kona]|uniref:DNA-directed RNA polymerase subunit n=1 Tax=Acrasis kona TaxID=1008807 RepID=A0AAW2ZBQ4_9EUKA